MTTNQMILDVYCVVSTSNYVEMYYLNYVNGGWEWKFVIAETGVKKFLNSRMHQEVKNPVLPIPELTHPYAREPVTITYYEVF